LDYKLVVQRRLHEAVYGGNESKSSCTRLSKITVNETLRLASLAPDIADAALQGTLPRTVSRYLFLRAAPPLDWEMQREMIDGFG